MAVKLKFHSWIQRGLARGLTPEADQLGNPASGQAGVEVGLKISGLQNAIRQTINLRGPGDVAGLNSAQIVRVEPKPNTPDFEPNFFPFVELISPELPWLFTNAKAVPGGRLRPWLALIVLEQTQDFEIKPASAGGNPMLLIESQAGQLLPDLKDAYAWGHIQESVVDTASAATVGERLDTSPSSFLARLICPVQLKKSSAYTAFLIPSFEAGRRAGLGMDLSDAGSADAWTGATERLELPVYYSWSFSTGNADFEALARRLKPFPVAETVGLHDLDIGHPRGGLDLEDLGGPLASRRKLWVSFEGVLRSPIAAPREWPANHKQAFQKELERVLVSKAKAVRNGEPYNALEHDPVINPPLYGSWQAQVTQPDSRKELPRWMDELNLDPAKRAIGGVATRIVRQHQEEFMAEAWEYARNVRTVQRELRQARLALLVGRRIHSRLAALSHEGWLQLTSPTYKRITTADGTKTLFAAVNGSKFVPSGITDSGFRRFSRAQQKKIRIFSNADISASLNLTRSATRACVVGAPAVKNLAIERRSEFISYQTSFEVETQPPLNRQRRAGRRDTATKILSGQDSLEQFKQESGDLRVVKAIGISKALQQAQVIEPDIDLNAIAVDSRAKTNPTATVQALLFKRVSGLAAPPAQAVPIPKFALIEMEFEEPVYRRLQALNPEFFLPGFGSIPNNTVSVLEVNPDFIESYLVGLNHEMSREFAWREYPAKLNQTWFKRFWDYIDEPETKDIDAVADWQRNSPLGSHAYGFRPSDKTGRMVLLIKGDLLRRYPNTVIYAARANWVKKEEIDNVKWEDYDPLAGQTAPLWAREATLAQEENIRLPIFMGEIGPDAHFLGFDLDVHEIYGSSKRADNRPGWFFVFEEHMTEPRFGLDLPVTFSPNTAPSRIQDLSWGHFGANQADLDALRYLPLVTPWSTQPIEGVKWGENSAEMARLTYQLPVRLMFHADALIAKAE
jgi:hypothetical protein